MGGCIQLSGGLGISVSGWVGGQGWSEARDKLMNTRLTKVRVGAVKDVAAVDLAVSEPSCVRHVVLGWEGSAAAAVLDDLGTCVLRPLPVQ